LIILFGDLEDSKDWEYDCALFAKGLVGLEGVVWNRKSSSQFSVSGVSIEIEATLERVLTVFYISAQAGRDIRLKELIGS
jgi:hypothetical protein